MFLETPERNFQWQRKVTKFAEKSKKKIKNYESEIALLRASKVENDKKSFSDEISDTFGHHFTMMRDLEHQIKQSFCKTLHRYERENEQQKLRIEELEKELEKIKREKLLQKNENEKSHQNGWKGATRSTTNFSNGLKTYFPHICSKTIRHFLQIFSVSSFSPMEGIYIFHLLTLISVLDHALVLKSS